MTGKCPVTDLPIAPLTPDEAEQAVALWAEAGLLKPWNDPRADIAAALACPASTILAARGGGRIVATVMVGYDGHRGWYYYLAVAQAHRGRGLGRAIITAAEAWLQARGAPAVRLMVREDNIAAAGFYRAIGYEQSEVIVMGRRFGAG
jgi:ribosomal protein S18 acetylase RimI-like enzyme